MIRDLGVEGEVLDNRDTDMLEAILDEAEKNPELARTLQGSLRVRFPEREVMKGGEVAWWDPDVRAWMKRAYERVPHLLYYLTPETPQLVLLSAAFRDIESIDIGLDDAQQEAVSEEFMRRVFTEHLVAAARFAERMADDSEPIMGKYLGCLKPPLAPAVASAVEAALVQSDPDRPSRD
jgi:hypothetical protein